MRAGDYYAAIVIPEDFSEDLVSILSGKIESPRIEYYLNEKKNAIAPKVTDTGAATIQQQVDETFVSVASEAAVEALQEAAKKASNDASQLNDNLPRKMTKASEKIENAEISLKNNYRTDTQNRAKIAKSEAALSSTEKAAQSASRSLKLTKDPLAVKLAESLDGMQPSFAENAQAAYTNRDGFEPVLGCHRADSRYFGKG